MRTVKVVVEVEVPEKATHYSGELTSFPCFYYCSQVGVVGDHWWYYHEGDWILHSHHKPHWIKELPA